MAKTYEELLEQAAIIRDETAAGKNTAERVGGTITDAVDYVKELKDTYAGIHAEAAEAKTAAAAAKTKNAEQDGKISSLEAKDATHDTKIADIEERVLQYLYPKIYQINEGAGARLFHGFYKGSASVSDERKTASEKGYSYKVVFKSGSFYLQEISPEGVTVLYSSWAEISLPNNKSIASSESYALRDCLYYIYVEGEGSTYYYIDSDGVASEKSATYLLRLLANKNASDIATLQGKDAAHDEKIATLHERDTALDGKISALEAKDTEHNAAIVAIQGKDATQDGKISSLEAKDATHDTKIEKLEERALQYIYPKIYQLNEGAGARVFHGFTKATGEGGLIITKDTYRYSVLYSTTQKQFVLNVTDEASGAGVRVGIFTLWPEISLPNNKSIASSESYAQRDCLYYIYVDGEGSTYYYIDSDGVASEKSATYLLRLLANKNASDIATLQGKDAAQDEKIATLHEHDTALDGKISALEAKDIEHNTAIVRNATVEYYDNSVIDGPSRTNTRATFKFFGADNNQLFMATLLGAGNGYPGLLSLKNKTKLDGYADTFSQNPAASSESNGLMSAEDKRKLDSVASDIQENSALIQENKSAIAANTQEIARVSSTAEQAVSTAQEAKSAAENEANARTEADAELQSQINGKQDNIGSFSADEKAAFLVSLGLGKIGIVSQKQTWNGVGVEPAYVMSEKVEGFISKDNIDSLISYGFAFNEGTGYFELNGLTDISLQEALNIVAAGKPNFSLCDLHYSFKKIRTNLPILDNSMYIQYFGTGIANTIRTSYMATNSDIEVFVYMPQTTDNNYKTTGLEYSKISQGKLAFYGCQKLEKIYVIPGTAPSLDEAFYYCNRLKELELVYLKCDVNLSSSAYLSAKSTHIMIANAKNSDAITITLHPDAKSRWEASEYYEEDGQTIIRKNITIA